MWKFSEQRIHSAYDLYSTQNQCKKPIYMVLLLPIIFQKKSNIMHACLSDSSTMCIVCTIVAPSSQTKKIFYTFLFTLLLFYSINHFKNSNSTHISIYNPSQARKYYISVICSDSWYSYKNERPGSAWNQLFYQYLHTKTSLYSYKHAHEHKWALYGPYLAISAYFTESWFTIFL